MLFHQRDLIKKVSLSEYTSPRFYLSDEFINNAGAKNLVWKKIVSCYCKNCRKKKFWGIPQQTISIIITITNKRTSISFWISNLWKTFKVMSREVIVVAVLMMVLLSSSMVQSRYLPTRGADDRILRLRQLLKDVSIFWIKLSFLITK